MASEKTPKKSSKPISKPNASSKPSAPFTFKSSELIDDSSSSSSDSEPTPKPTKSKSKSKSKSRSEAKAKALVTGLSSPEAPRSKKRKSDVPTEPVLPQVNGKAAGKKAEKVVDEFSDTSETSEDLDDDDGAADKVANGGGATEDSEDGGSESSDEGEDSDDSGDAMEVDTPAQQSERDVAAKRRQMHISSGKADDWKPPKDFERVQLDSKTNERLASKLSADALAGKEIWHITVPEGLDMSQIATIHPGMLDKGEAALQQDGVDYTLYTTRKRDLLGTSIMVPDVQGNSYTQLRVPISRSLDLRQSLRGAENGDDEDKEAINFDGLDPKLLVAQKTYPKAAPPSQPAGLKQEYQPLGVLALEEPAVFRQPRSLPTNGEPSPEKKRKKGKSKAENMPEQAPATNGQASPEEKKKDMEQSRDEDSAEERAQRRREKAERKAAKEKRKLAKAAAK